MAQQILEETRSSHRQRTKLTALFVFGLLVASLAVATPVVQENAEAQVVYPSVSWSANGATARVSGNANLQRFGCGVLHCSTTTSAYAISTKSGGAAVPNAYQVSMQAEQPVLTGSVSVGSGGVSVGAVVQGQSCVSQTYSSAPGAGYVSVSSGGEFCTARGATAFSLTYKVSGANRIGSSWSFNSASAQGG